MLNPFNNIRFAVTGEEIAAMYAKRAAHHREKANRCESALAELGRSQDLKKAITAALGDRAVPRAAEQAIDHLIAASARQQENLIEQAEAAISDAMGHHKREADHCDWLAAHVDKQSAATITEIEARGLREIFDGKLGLVPQIPFAKHRHPLHPLSTLGYDPFGEQQQIDGGFGIASLFA